MIITKTKLWTRLKLSSKFISLKHQIYLRFLRCWQPNGKLNWLILLSLSRSVRVQAANTKELSECLTWNDGIDLLYAWLKKCFLQSIRYLNYQIDEVLPLKRSSKEDINIEILEFKRQTDPSFLPRFCQTFWCQRWSVLLKHL